MEVGLLINGLKDVLVTSIRSLLTISVSLLVLEIYLLNIIFCQFICFRNLLNIISVSLMILEIYFLIIIFISLSVLEIYLFITIFVGLFVFEKLTYYF